MASALCDDGEARSDVPGLAGLAGLLSPAERLLRYSRTSHSQPAEENQPTSRRNQQLHSFPASSQLPASDPNKAISYCKMFIASEGAGGASKGTAS